MSNTSWAGAVSPTSITTEFLASLAPTSAGAKLIAPANVVSLAGKNSVLIPARLGGVPSADVLWPQAGDPIEVQQGALDSVKLGPPKKLSTIVVATRELLEQANSETALGLLIRENAGVSLDVSLFSDAAEDATRPPGLFANVTPIEAATGIAGMAWHQSSDHDLAHIGAQLRRERLPDDSNINHVAVATSIGNRTGHARSRHRCRGSAGRSLQRFYC